MIRTSVLEVLAASQRGSYSSAAAATTRAHPGRMKARDDALMTRMVGRIWTGNSLVGLIILAGALSFLPFAIALLFRIWAPAAMVEETFSANYLALPLMQLPSASYHLILVGHFSILLLSYLPRLITQVVDQNASQFSQAELFGLLCYAWTGLLTFALLVMVTRSRIPVTAKLALVLLPSASVILERSTNLGLFISYDKSEALVYACLSFLLIKRMQGPGQHLVVTAVVAGVGAAAAITTKWTLATIVVPLFVVAASPSSAKPLGKLTWSVINFVLSFVVSTGLIYLAYYLFRIDYTLWSLKSLVDVYQSDWTSQFATPIVYEITRVLDPKSFYIGFQIEFIATIGSLSLLILALWSRKSWSYGIVIVALLPAILTFAYLFYRRTTQSTVAEFIVFMAFLCSLGIGVASIEAARRRSRAWQLAAATPLALIIAGYVISVATYDELGVLNRIARNSEGARELNAFYEAHSGVPVHYYLAAVDWQHQSIVFPDIALYSFLALQDRTPGGYLQTYYPRDYFTRIDHGLEPGAQVMVVPEVFDIPPEFAGGIMTVNVFDNVPEFRTVRDTADCRQVQMDEVQSREYIVNFYVYKTRVTVCSLPR